MTPSDESLVAAFQGGDVSAFDELVMRWDRKIQAAIFRILGSTEEAQDLCQEAFLKAYRALPGFKGEAKFSSWLYQIALNLCRDRLRRRRGRTFVSWEGLEAPERWQPTAREPSASEMVEAADRSRAVAAAVAELPEEQRLVIVLKEYEDLTFVEVAEVLGLPLSTVKTRLYRGLVQLRAKLEHRGVHSPAAVAAPTP